MPQERRHLLQLYDSIAVSDSITTVGQQISDGAGGVLVYRCMLLSLLTISGLIAVLIDSLRSLQPRALTHSGLH